MCDLTSKGGCALQASRAKIIKIYRQTTRHYQTSRPDSYRAAPYCRSASNGIMPVLAWEVSPDTVMVLAPGTIQGWRSHIFVIRETLSTTRGICVLWESGHT